MASSSTTGAPIIAQALRHLGVTAIFGLVGVPISGIAEQVINLGIRFIGFAMSKQQVMPLQHMGILTGKPGVCLVVGGPGVLHVIAGVCHSFSHRGGA